MKVSWWCASVGESWECVWLYVSVIEFVSGPNKSVRLKKKVVLVKRWSTKKHEILQMKNANDKQVSKNSCNSTN